MASTPPRVFLIGLMGSGKSTVGRRLSTRTGWPYVDNDALILAATGRTAPEIAAGGGEDALHAAELAAFAHGAALPPPVIVGVAGFVVMDADSRATMTREGTVVWLRARPETLHLRVGSGLGRRPAATSLEWVRGVVAERSATFESVADIVIDVDRLRPRVIVDQIVGRLGAETGPN